MLLEAEAVISWGSYFAYECLGSVSTQVGSDHVRVACRAESVPAMMKLQKLYFSPNWICLALFDVLVTRPPAAVSIAVFGAAK